ncbi:MAG: NUDIX domain-containing protein [Patescibacteria group bacterium]|nr:NUDIX domain-containing protein [Patescibacteria group bacterium]
MQREISAGIIIYRRDVKGPRFLLLYHGSDYWNFPKGHIEKEPAAGGREETSLEAALRETKEETGLTPGELKVNRKFKGYERFSFYKGKSRIFKIVIFYLGETKQKQIKVSEEHEGYGWFYYRDALRLVKGYRDTAAVLKRANDFIRFSAKEHNRPAHLESETPRPKSESVLKAE